MLPDVGLLTVLQAKKHKLATSEKAEERPGREWKSLQNHVF